MQDAREGHHLDSTRSPHERAVCRKHRQLVLPFWQFVLPAPPVRQKRCGALGRVRYMPQSLACAQMMKPGSVQKMMQGGGRGPTLFACSAAAPSLKKRAYKKAMADDAAFEEDDDRCGVSNLNEEEKVDAEGTDAPKEKILSQIISQQKFDGSWMTDDIASILQMASGDIHDDVQSSVLMTALVVVLLQECYSDRAPEWGLLVTKAKNFLKQGSAGDIDETLKAAKDRLDALRAKYPGHAVFT
ncbi:uncharacterized protein LOC108667877 [Hyalella azteca]|uniref:Uncharacterized protein LOC108667877 n=1 Tax=Hyalella azteca TaxID=294128 RepID=A0A8B7NA57_HYAAZ|nr:uncharacterized protein LOC108667877 [Hyalella azteca]